MGSDTEHRERIHHNREFYERFIQSIVNDFRDWTIVILFYISVHCIECYRWAQYEENSADHDDRAWFLGGEHPYQNQQLGPLYEWLLKKSITARYDPQSHVRNHRDYITDFELLKFKEHVNCFLDLVNEPPIP